FRAMQEIDCDYWGITDSLAVGRHIQSDFLVFRKPVIASPIFADFWRNLVPSEDKRQLIVQCESRMSQELARHGFRPAALFKEDLRVRIRAAALAGKRCVQQFILHPAALLRPGDVWHSAYRFNDAQYFWKDVIRQRMPFVKVELMRLNTMGV